jgi:hypothetical protein
MIGVLKGWREHNLAILQLENTVHVVVCVWIFWIGSMVLQYKLDASHNI